MKKKNEKQKGGEKGLENGKPEKEEGRSGRNRGRSFNRYFIGEVMCDRVHLHVLVCGGAWEV